jgi:hypothetical protein
MVILRIMTHVSLAVHEILVDSEFGKFTVEFVSKWSQAFISHYLLLLRPNMGEIQTKSNMRMRMMLSMNAPDANEVIYKFSRQEAPEPKKLSMC